MTVTLMSLLNCLNMAYYKYVLSFLYATSTSKLIFSNEAMIDDLSNL